MSKPTRSPTPCRKIGKPGTIYPVKAMLGILAAADVSDEEIDAFIAGYDDPGIGYIANSETASAYEFVETPSGRLRYAMRPGDGVPGVMVSAVTLTTGCLILMRPQNPGQSMPWTCPATASRSS